MDFFALLLILCFVLSTYFLHVKKSNFTLVKRTPPKPTSLPVIGNILELGLKPHKSLAKLSKTYGPLMSLQLGSLSTVIVSSPEIARIVLQKHDQTFSGRVIPDAIRTLDHDKHSVAWLSTNNINWRKLRKIFKEQMFSASKLEASQELRMEKLGELSDYVNECCVSGQVVDIGKVLFTISLNLISASLFSMEGITNCSDKLVDELRDAVSGIMELVGKPNLSDYFAFLKYFDPQGFLRKNTINFKKCFVIFDKVIEKRLKTRRASSDYTPKKDTLEALIDIKEKGEVELSFDEIKHLMMDVFVGGTDTSSVTVEWAMTELMRDPDKMLKAKNELRSVVGCQGERVQESDISRLPYLRAVIKETFRLHPTVPLLLPHKSEADIKVNDYLICKNTQVLVNVWAIGRDPNVWSNPDVFMPERFLEQEIDFRGTNFELIPFGAGRRLCPGLPLASRMVHLLLATLIHNFNWKLEQGLQLGDIDIDDKFGCSLQKATPLKLIPFH